MGVALYETEKLFADVAYALPQIEEIEKGFGTDGLVVNSYFHRLITERRAR